MALRIRPERRGEAGGSVPAGRSNGHVPWLLEADSLYRFYRVEDEETLALRGVSLRVAGGEMVAVTGPSGSGKSTLLACLAGLDEPSGGSVRVNGLRISHRPERVRSSLRAQHIGVLFQANNLFAHLTVTQNVRLAQSLGRRARPDDVRALLGDLAIAHRAAALPRELSGGEAARAGLAVALANDPDVLVADEPTGELDTANASRLLDLLGARVRRGRAVVIASHSPAVARFADRVVTLVDGEVRR